MEMKFIQQLVCFEEKSRKVLTPNAIAVYFHLFMVNNRCGWREWFTQTDYFICEAVGISRRESILRAINLLEKEGFIEIERGGAHKPTKYRIIPLFNSAFDSALDSGIDSALDRAFCDGNALFNSAFDSGNPKHKHKNKNKDICASAFATFWDAYPKRKDKVKAKKAFEKINPSQELLQVMLSSIEKSKQSDDWKKSNGQYIPYPATWLNGHRWEDEDITSTPLSDTNFDYDPEAVNFGIEPPKEATEYGTTG